MPSIVDILRGAGQAAGVAGQFVKGYGEDQQTNAAAVIAADKAKREAENDRVRNLVAMGGIDPGLQGQIEGAKETAKSKAKGRTVHTTLTDPVSGIVHIVYDDGSVDSQQPTIAGAPAAGSLPALPPAAPTAAPPQLKLGVKPPDSTKGQSEIPGTPEWKAAEQFKSDLALSRSRSLAASKPHVETPDQIKSKTVESLATPAADQLLGYFHGHKGAGLQQTAGGIASHVPLIGNYLEGQIDPHQQAADDAAETLATQYLEIMPKSRFQPTTVAEIRKQISYSPADSPEKQAQKIARIGVLKAAIQARAKNPTDLTGILDDAPPPP